MPVARGRRVRLHKWLTVRKCANLWSTCDKTAAFCDDTVPHYSKFIDEGHPRVVAHGLFQIFHLGNLRNHMKATISHSVSYVIHSFIHTHFTCDRTGMWGVYIQTGTCGFVTDSIT